MTLAEPAVSGAVELQEPPVKATDPATSPLSAAATVAVTVRTSAVRVVVESTAVTPVQFFMAVRTVCGTLTNAP